MACRRRYWATSLLALLFAALASIASGEQHGADGGVCKVARVDKRRLFVLTDIANEPDDAQSLVRLMVYANEFRIEGLVATTSYWLNDTVRPDQIHDIVQAYGETLPNLKQHASGWPEVDQLVPLIKSGSTLYGMAGVGPGQDTEGSKLLVEAVDASEERLWVPIWGGSNVLAQALWHVNATRSPAEVDRFVSKLRVYAISDQDNSGPWIRRNWPGLFYIASVHHFNRYAHAAWGGISGDNYYHFPSTASVETISDSWLKKNIQIGPLGAKYPDSEFIIEGDTPSLLYMIPNGLSDPQYPEWGSWGGRYGPVVWGEGHFADSIDIITDEAGGRTIMDSHATVWRWRSAFQNDFKARMQWTMQPAFSGASHAPVPVVNGSATDAVLRINVEAGQSLVLDASQACDPDGDGTKLSFKWWQYKEPSSNNNNPKRDVSEVGFDSQNSAKVTIQVPEESVLRRPGRGAHPGADKHMHIILEVSNENLVAYRRIVLTSRKDVTAGESSNAPHDEL
ncbi:hypothetical protein A1O1_04698 [Capronia coronata CBS 617.96]|uniref:Cellulose-binding protein n=1 Tax=Capronia coronata CBS 617.96 TaxID=1182541 RepID=W9YES9_9EURO|nr:uncharacterized protein A1O1_04698 [Capronia coronata CBS 617.96]EXJ87771.1 hypothetical protein A1O1_04698 [Capronia coronata CBS 617.96]